MHAPSGAGQDADEGFDAFVPLIDPGISLYVWTSRRFLALVLFTGKEFDTSTAVRTTTDFFSMTDSAQLSF